MSRSCRLIIAPWKVGVIKTNICPRSEASKGKYANIKNIKFPRGINTLLSFMFSIKFSSARQFKFQNHIELVLTFLDESRKSQMENLEKKTNKNSLIQFQLFIFYKPACLQKYFHG